MNVVILALAGAEPRFHLLADFCEMALQPFKPLAIQDAPPILGDKDQMYIEPRNAMSTAAYFLIVSHIGVA